MHLSLSVASVAALEKSCSGGGVRCACACFVKAAFLAHFLTQATSEVIRPNLLDIHPQPLQSFNISIFVLLCRVYRV